MVSEGVKTLPHILTEHFSIQEREHKPSQVSTGTNRCGFPRLCPREKKIKILLDADVLKAASLSCNLAKAMPAVFNAKLE